MQNALWLLALSALFLATPLLAVAKENVCVKKVAYDALLRLDQRLKMEHKSGLRDTILDGAVKKVQQLQSKLFKLPATQEPLVPITEFLNLPREDLKGRYLDQATKTIAATEAPVVDHPLRDKKKEDEARAAKADELIQQFLDLRDSTQKELDRYLWVVRTDCIQNAAWIYDSLVSSALPPTAKLGQRTKPSEAELEWTKRSADLSADEAFKGKGDGDEGNDDKMIFAPRALTKMLNQQIISQLESLQSSDPSAQVATKLSIATGFECDTTTGEFGHHELVLLGSRVAVVEGKKRVFGFQFAASADDYLVAQHLFCRVPDVQDKLAQFKVVPATHKEPLAPFFLNAIRHPYCGQEIDITAYLSDLGNLLTIANKQVVQVATTPPKPTDTDPYKRATWQPLFEKVFGARAMAFACDRKKKAKEGERDSSKPVYLTLSVASSRTQSCRNGIGPKNDRIDALLSVVLKDPPAPSRETPSRKEDTAMANPFAEPKPAKAPRKEFGGDTLNPATASDREIEMREMPQRKS